MTLADQLVVLEDGRVTQTGTPDQVSAHPRSRYVAELVGLNLFRGRAADGSIALADGNELVAADDHHSSGEVFAVVHPRAVALYREQPEGSPRNVWPGTAEALDVAGDRVRVRIDGPVPAGGRGHPGRGRRAAPRRRRPGLGLGQGRPKCSSTPPDRRSHGSAAAAATARHGRRPPRRRDAGGVQAGRLVDCGSVDARSRRQPCDDRRVARRRRQPPRRRRQALPRARGPHPAAAQPRVPARPLPHRGGLARRRASSSTSATPPRSTTSRSSTTPGPEPRLWPASPRRSPAPAARCSPWPSTSRFPTGRRANGCWRRFPVTTSAVPAIDSHHQPLFAVYGPGCLAAMTEHARDAASTPSSTPFPRCASPRCRLPATRSFTASTRWTSIAARALARQSAAPRAWRPRRPAPPALVAVVGKSDSGKTTLIEKLVPELVKLGLRVGTVKHDAHSFEIDHPGKDSWRHGQAGAQAYVDRLAASAWPTSPSSTASCRSPTSRGATSPASISWSPRATSARRRTASRSSALGAGHDAPLCGPGEAMALVTDAPLEHEHRSVSTRRAARRSSSPRASTPCAATDALARRAEERRSRLTAHPTATYHRPHSGSRARIAGTPEARRWGTNLSRASDTTAEGGVRPHPRPAGRSACTFHLPRCAARRRSGCAPRLRAAADAESTTNYA